MKALVGFIFLWIAFSTTSLAQKYSCFDRNISLYIAVDTVKDSLISHIKIINRSTSDIYISGGYFYVHKGWFGNGGTVAPFSNVFDLGHEKQSQDYLHLGNSFYKLAKHDSISYSYTSDIPALTKKLTINFDYLNSGDLSKKFIRKNVRSSGEHLYSINQLAYHDKCTSFRFVLQ